MAFFFSMLFYLSICRLVWITPCWSDVISVFLLDICEFRILTYCLSNLTLPCYCIKRFLYFPFIFHTYIAWVHFFKLLIIVLVEFWSIEPEGSCCCCGSHSKCERKSRHRCIPSHQSSNHDAWTRTTSNNIKPWALEQAIYTGEVHQNLASEIFPKYPYNTLNPSLVRPWFMVWTVITIQLQSTTARMSWKRKCCWIYTKENGQMVSPFKDLILMQKLMRRLYRSFCLLIVVHVSFKLANPEASVWSYQFVYACWSMNVLPFCRRCWILPLSIIKPFRKRINYLLKSWLLRM